MYKKMGLFFLKEEKKKRRITEEKQIPIVIAVPLHHGACAIS